MLPNMRQAYHCSASSGIYLSIVRSASQVSSPRGQWSGRRLFLLLCPCPVSKTRGQEARGRYCLPLIPACYSYSGRSSSAARRESLGVTPAFPAHTRTQGPTTPPRICPHGDSIARLWGSCVGELYRGAVWGSCVGELYRGAVWGRGPQPWMQSSAYFTLVPDTQ